MSAKKAYIKVTMYSLMTCGQVVSAVKVKLLVQLARCVRDVPEIHLREAHPAYKDPNTPCWDKTRNVTTQTEMMLL